MRMLICNQTLCLNGSLVFIYAITIL